jgi:hypothetical protein
MRYLEQGFSQSLVERQTEIDLALRALLGTRVAQPNDAGPIAQREQRGSRVAHARAFFKLTRLRRMLSQVRSRWTSPDPETLRLFEEILRRASELATSWNGELVVVSLPGVWNFDPQSGVPSWAGIEARERVREIAGSLGLRFIDVQPAMAKHRDPLSLYSYPGQSLLGTPHMNAAGYALAAEVVRTALED